MKEPTYQVFWKPKLKEGEDLSAYDWSLENGIKNLDKSKDFAENLETDNVFIHKIEYEETDAGEADEAHIGRPVEKYLKLNTTDEWGVEPV